MAGIYPNVPNNRMAYDADGTTCVFVSSGSVTGTLTLAQVKILNNENDDAIDFSGGYGTVAIVFPELRDVTAISVNLDSSQGWTVEWSANTSNGADGTWTVLGNQSTPNGMVWGGSVVPAYRNNIVTVSLSGVRSIRVTTGGPVWNRIRAVHLYGRPSSGSNLDRVELWNPTLDERITGSYFDFGESRRGTDETRSFRIKNLSTTKTANNIVLATSILVDGSPSILGQYTISDNGVNFYSTRTLASLAPNTISGLYYLKRTTSVSDALGVWALRISATPESMT